MCRRTVLLLLNPPTRQGFASLAEQERDNTREVHIYEDPYDCVISPSSNGYWQRRGTYENSESSGWRIERDKSGYHAHCVGTDWFKSLSDVVSFYNEICQRSVAAVLATPRVADPDAVADPAGALILDVPDPMNLDAGPWTRTILSTNALAYLESLASRDAVGELESYIISHSSPVKRYDVARRQLLSLSVSGWLTLSPSTVAELKHPSGDQELLFSMRSRGSFYRGFARDPNEPGHHKWLSLFGWHDCSRREDALLIKHPELLEDKGPT